MDALTKSLAMHEARASIAIDDYPDCQTVVLPPALTLFVPGIPQQRGSKSGFPVRRKNGSIGVAMADSNKRSKPWMQCVASEAQAVWSGDLIRGPVSLGLTFRFPRPKSHYGTGRNASKLKPSAPQRHAQTPDLSKLARAVEDALTGVVWHDDKLVCDYHRLCREWTTEAAGVLIEIVEIPNA